MTLPTLSDILSCKNLFCVCKLTCKLVQMLGKKSLFSVDFIQPHSSFHAVVGSLLLQHCFSCLSILTWLSNSTGSPSPVNSFISSSSVTLYLFLFPTYILHQGDLIHCHVLCSSLHCAMGIFFPEYGMAGLFGSFSLNITS